MKAFSLLCATVLVVIGIGVGAVGLSSGASLNQPELETAKGTAVAFTQALGRHDCNELYSLTLRQPGSEPAKRWMLLCRGALPAFRSVRVTSESRLGIMRSGYSSAAVEVLTTTATVITGWTGYPPLRREHVQIMLLVAEPKGSGSYRVVGWVGGSHLPPLGPAIGWTGYAPLTASG